MFSLAITTKVTVINLMPSDNLLNEKDKIDFVLIWVDGSDPIWQAEKSKFLPPQSADTRSHRYRDWDNLQFWFRGVEKYAPWVNKIHFVTFGHLPKWLNLSNPKLNIVKHEDFIPPEYLPTFSSHTIENNLHRIKGLSEKFVYFNDDTFLIKSSKTTDFFYNGIPCDTAILTVLCNDISDAILQISFNNVGLINEEFNFKDTIKNNFSKWINFKYGAMLLRSLILLPCPRFPGFWQHHLASSFLKSTYEEIWNKKFLILDETCKNKFRSPSDVNQWIFKAWQIVKGNFAPRSPHFGGRYFFGEDVSANKVTLRNATEGIINHKQKCISINDGEMSLDEFEKLRTEIAIAFNTILPEKCGFEL